MVNRLCYSQKHVYNFLLRVFYLLLLLLTKDVAMFLSLTAYLMLSPQQRISEYVYIMASAYLMVLMPRPASHHDVTSKAGPGATGVFVIQYSPFMGINERFCFCLLICFSLSSGRSFQNLFFLFTAL